MMAVAHGRFSLERRPVRIHSVRLFVWFGAGLLVLVGCGSATTEPSAASTATVVQLPTLDPSQVAEGRQIYLRNCSSCHGENAQGAPNWQQPNARGDLPAPPHDASGHTWRHSDAQLREIIQNGLRDRFNKTPALTMPPFRGRLSDEQIRSLLAYFKSLWTPKERRYQEQLNQRSEEATPRP